MGTATADQFINIITDIWKNHGIYFWGGNGEYTENLYLKQIRAQELSLHDVARVLRHIADCYDAGYVMTKSRAVDCSGLVIAALRDLHCIKSTEDYRARDLQKMSKAVELDKLKPGDCVYNKEKDATHMGVYAGYNMVIEAAGRDVGVVKRQLSAGKWVVGGRLPYIK